MKLSTAKFSLVQEYSHGVICAVQDYSHVMSDEMGQIVEVKEEISGQLSLLEPAEVVRPDINIAKWAGYLFSSPWAKDLYEEKKIIFFLPHGSQASIAIIPAKNRKRPTTTTQRILYALFQLWEESGKPKNGRFSFSARQLCFLADLKWAGKKTAKMIQEHLSILNSSTLDWERSFFYEGELEIQKEEMHIIDAKSYLSREKMENQEFFYGQHKIRLNQDLVDNMIAGKTKPFNYRAFVSIKNDGAIKLYNLLDNFLSQKNHWERRSKALINEDLELTGKRYDEKRIRLAKLKELVKALDGKELSSGILHLSIKDTVDGEDYKIAAQKTPKKTTARFPSKLANKRGDIPGIVKETLDTLEIAGSVDRAGSKKVIEHLARWYPRTMILACASSVKVDYQGVIKKSVIKTFMYLVHTEAHKRGYEWIKDCGENCRYREQNQNIYQADFIEKRNQKSNSKTEKVEKQETKSDVKKEAEIKAKARQEQMQQAEDLFRQKAVDAYIESLSEKDNQALFDELKESIPTIIRKSVKDLSHPSLRIMISRRIPDFDSRLGQHLNTLET